MMMMMTEGRVWSYEYRRHTNEPFTPPDRRGPMMVGESCLASVVELFQRRPFEMIFGYPAHRVLALHLRPKTNIAQRRTQATQSSRSALLQQIQLSTNPPTALMWPALSFRHPTPTHLLNNKPHLTLLDQRSTPAILRCE